MVTGGRCQNLLSPAAVGALVGRVRRQAYEPALMWGPAVGNVRNNGPEIAAALGGFARLVLNCCGGPNPTLSSALSAVSRRDPRSCK
ncbi:hypothetical protein ACFFX0_32265 [Citricoccus parietis]|uniref:Uncharacterized protein n=1 Tax=Citricoccus parietis TaxID=592307 RepID=A0ABV5GAE8_9MICC